MLWTHGGLKIRGFLPGNIEQFGFTSTSSVCSAEIAGVKPQCLKFENILGGRGLEDAEIADFKTLIKEADTSDEEEGSSDDDEDEE